VRLIRDFTGWNACIIDKFPIALGLAAILLSSTAIQSPAYASAKEKTTQAQPDQTVAMSADEVTHDRNLDIVTARGNVEINQTGHTVFADTISYNINQDVVTATGNVSIISPDGSVAFADHIDLTGQLKQGALKNLLLISKDRTRMAAYSASRTIGHKGQQINQLNNAVYSPCDSCAGDTNPLWQIKAVKIVHDEATKDIVYNHAFLEFYGVPVLYTPYLFHADPTVKRRSGLLAPSIGSSSNLGTFYRHPYYLVTSPHSDVTITPMLTSDAPSILIGEYRQNFADGQFVINGSGRIGGSYDSETRRDSLDNERRVQGDDANRGQVDFQGQWNINDTWRARADLHATSSDTYKERYKLLEPDNYYTNIVALEAFAGNDYAKVEAISFRELRDIYNPQKSPFAAPRAEWNHVSAPGEKGGYWSTTFSTAALSRSGGANNQRVSGATAWTLPYISPTGEHYTLTASLRSDLYNVNDYTHADGSEYSGTTGRIIPEASLSWSWPFSAAGKHTTQIIEPIVIASLSPNGGNPTDIPNEDSLDVALNAANALQTNHFVGYDRVETGPRVTYGLNWDAYMNGSSGKISTFLGQTYRTHKDAAFGNNSGFKDGVSDFVGRIEYTYSDAFKTAYRFKLDEDSLEPTSSDFSIEGGSDILRLRAAYINEKDQEDISTGELSDVDQIALSASSKLSQYWSISGATQHDLSSNGDGGPLSASLSAAYEDECFSFRLTGTNDYTSDRDADAGLAVMMTLVFKTMGTTQFNM